MKIVIEKTLHVPVEREIKRIKEVLKGREQKRALAVVMAFKDGNFKKALDLYDKLPRSKDEYPEQEHIGEFFTEFFGQLNSYDLRPYPFALPKISVLKTRIIETIDEN
jgi:hypothetical protein